MRFLIRTLVTAAALWLATVLLAGIWVTGTSTVQNGFTLLAMPSSSDW